MPPEPNPDSDASSAASWIASMRPRLDALCPNSTCATTSSCGSGGWLDKVSVGDEAGPLTVASAVIFAAA